MKTQIAALALLFAPAFAHAGFQAKQTGGEALKKRDDAYPCVIEAMGVKVHELSLDSQDVEAHSEEVKVTDNAFFGMADGRSLMVEELMDESRENNLGFLISIFPKQSYRLGMFGSDYVVFLNKKAGTLWSLRLPLEDLGARRACRRTARMPA